MQSKIIQTTNGPVEFTMEGQGDAVLFIHGGNGTCFSNFRQEPLLREGFRVLIPSRPGYGQTPISAGRTAAEQAGMLAALLSALQVESVSLIGASAGGPTGLEFARRYPAMTRCLILEEAVTTTWVPRWFPQYWAMKWFLHPRRQEKTWQSQRRQFQEDRQAHLISLAKMFSLLDPQEVVSQWDQEDIDYYQELLFSFDSGPGFIHTMDHKAMDIQEIRAPVLIMHSMHDRNVPFHHALNAYRKIQGSELFAVPPLSHLIYMGEGKEAVLERRLAFLEAHKSAAVNESKRTK